MTWKDVTLWQAGTAIGLMILVAAMRISNAEGWVRILDDANLVFHEAGHAIFGLLGSTMGLYGGTLGQLAIPTMCSLHFWRRGDTIPFALCLAWVFENFLNISRYMADARAQLLPLVGGGEHDWVNIFANWHVIQYDIQIANAVKLVGWVGYWTCALWLIFRASCNFRNPESSKSL